MSSLYDVAVAELGENHVDFDVTVVHPDAGEVPDDATFAFRILYDPIHRYPYQDQPEVKGSPLAAEMDLRDYLNESFIQENARGFIASSEYVSEENHPPPYWGDEGYQEFWDSEQRSVARIRVTVTHPGWLAHLSVGQSWDTAAYGTYDATAWEGPTRRPGDRVVEISEDPMEGMRTRSRDRRMREYAKDLVLDTYVIPVLGVGHYITKDALCGEGITVEAVRELLGCPVLVVGGWRGREVGMLASVSDEGHIQVYNESGGGYGTSGMSLGDLESIGRAWYMRRVSIDEVGV